MLEKKVKKIRRQLRHQAFNGDLVKFCENNFVGDEEESNLIGELRSYDQDTVDGLSKLIGAHDSYILFSKDYSLFT